LIEEKRLLGDFGEEYTEYKKRTSMLIPFPSKQGMKEKD
jgi:protein-S-isoprenylcysteine O-methyltransferase Ste14